MKIFIYIVAVAIFSLECMLTIGYVASVVRPVVRGWAFLIESAQGAVALTIAILLLPYVLKGP